MNHFFNPDSWLWKPFSYVADVVLLSCLWFVCSVPIVTIGAATAAMYDVAARCIRGGDRAFFARFFRTFKRELPLATLSWLLWAAVTAGVFLLVRLYGNSAAVTYGSTALTIAGLTVTVVLIGISCWVFPLLSRFSFSFGSLNLTALKLAVSRLPATVLIGLLTVGGVYVCVRFWMPTLVVPALAALLWSLPMERAFRKYTHEE